MLNPGSLVVPLILVSIGFVLAGLSTSDWHCGNLFTQCGHDLTNIILIVLFCGGLLLLSVVFCIDVLGLCADNWVPGPVCASFKLLALFLGGTCILCATVIYTWAHNPRWSYFFTIIGAVTSMHAVLIGLSACRCMKS